MIKADVSLGDSCHDQQLYQSKYKTGSATSIMLPFIAGLARQKDAVGDILLGMALHIEIYCFTGNIPVHTLLENQASGSLERGA